jgi:thioester reductase-like protein
MQRSPTECYRVDRPAGAVASLNSHPVTKYKSETQTTNHPNVEELREIMRLIALTLRKAHFLSSIMTGCK